MASTADGVKLDAMMRKITGLLAKADHPNTPEPEADACRAMAEKMMVKYSIDESELIESGALASEAITPGFKSVPMSPADSEFAADYRAFMGYIVSHAGCRMAYGYDMVDGLMYEVAKIVGYEADIRFAEMLFTSARIVFAERMEPKPIDSMSDEDNVYRMRSAGMERIRIAKLMGWGETGSATAKVTRMYKAACKARNEDSHLTGRNMSVKVFREMYAEGFRTELYYSLSRARNAADSGSSGGLVLAGRKDKVDEAFYVKYPHLRPTPVERSLGEEPKRRKARQYKETAADRKAMERRYSPAGQAGSRAGARAAAEVNVGDKPKPQQRLN